MKKYIIEIYSVEMNKDGYSYKTASKKLVHEVTMDEKTKKDMAVRLIPMSIDFLNEQK